MQPRYDVFISYSSGDRDWVRQALIARLEQAGLSVCIDFRDFDVGVPALVNIERAVERSRATLLVLTPSWVRSEWTAFESLLLQHRDPSGDQQRMLPLLLLRCDIPQRLGIFTHLDLTDPAEHGAQLARLIATIRNSPARTAAPAVPNATFPPNPFGDIGRIADPARFFDREDLLRRIFEELGKGVNLSLVGDSQIGKSSLLEMVCAQGPQRLSPPAVFAHLNLELVDNEGEFYEALCEALGIVPACRGFQLTRALRGRRYVLCLDEIEKMAWDGFTIGLRSHLRGLADGPAAPLKLVIASHSPLSQLFPDATELTSPLANICRQIDVGPFA